jgi:hypothetical protein
MKNVLVVSRRLRGRRMAVDDRQPGGSRLNQCGVCGARFTSEDSTEWKTRQGHDHVERIHKGCEPEWRRLADHRKSGGMVS